jgi:arylsulfatase A-like enzyme
LDLAGIKIPQEMNARSFLNILQSEKEGIVDQTRNYVVTGRERHAFARKNGTGYGARAIRTKDFLYIKNYDYESWPAGDPPLYGDVDAHMLHYPCATKMYMLKNRDKEGVKELFELGFGMRPEEELYDLRNDPFQMNNVAYSKEYEDEKISLSEKLAGYLKANQDPRELGGEMKWLGAKYFAEKDFYPRPSEEARKELGLEEEYSYIDQ